MTALLKDQALHDGTVMQGFAWTGRNWLFSQVTGDGRAGRSYEWHSSHGDVTLTLVSPSGDRLGHMFLRGFGHGISLGAERRLLGLWVWTEVLSMEDPDTGKGFGTAVARFRWRPGRTVTPQSRGVAVRQPLTGVEHVTPHLDLANGIVAVRYRRDGVVRVARYRLGAFRRRVYAPLTVTTEPRHEGTGQGWACAGAEGWTVLARLEGDAYGPSNPPPGNAVITRYTADGAVVSREPCEIAAHLTWREPEGLLVKDGELLVGFASGQHGDRRANIYLAGQ
ncbi:MAG TPA: hypothetical protein VIV12_05440 [Streptosporangiaceae bacterium]